MQGVADDFGNRSVVGKYNVGHSREIFVEKRPKHVGFERLNQRGEARDVAE